MTPIAELDLDLADTSDKVRVRLFAPVAGAGPAPWTCRFEIGEPFDVSKDIVGETSFQALALALKGLSAVLYGSDIYKDGRLGVFGEFGGYLTIPAPNVMLDAAPFPF